ncbi:hypothetical protein AMS66_07610 [Paenibacillus xylanivorans]|uniref:Uncharacterized protein n=1 Tax=Paenibacillus xylanivorans TaxID=1705561 RepID=A0A0N0C552_9BACL|nr:hypothetical protein AMS66_07610 [Paenibacillus xylanivorans]
MSLRETGGFFIGQIVKPIATVSLSGSPAQTFSWSKINLSEIGAFREKISKQAIRIFIRTALPNSYGL